MAAFFTFLAAQGFITLFFVLGFGQLVGRIRIGFFSPGSTAGALLVALVVGSLAFHVAGVRFAIPDLLTTLFLALFTYAIGLRVGPQFIEGLRQQGVQLIVLVLVTTTLAFVMAFGGGRLLGLQPGLAAGVLSGSNTISAVMGVATAAVDQGLYTVPAGLTAEQVKANIAAGYSLSYILSILGIVLLVRNLPSMFGFDPVQAARKSEEQYGAKGHALPGTSEAFDVGVMPVGLRVFRLEADALAGRPASDIFDRFDTPVLKLTRGSTVVSLASNPRDGQGRSAHGCRPYRQPAGRSVEPWPGGRRRDGASHRSRSGGDRSREECHHRQDRGRLPQESLWHTACACERSSGAATSSRSFPERRSSGTTCSVS